MKRLLACFIALLWASSAWAQGGPPVGFFVVTTCGTVPNAYTASQVMTPTIDINGNVCMGSGGGNFVTAKAVAVAPTATVFSSVLAVATRRTSCVVTNIGTTQGYCQAKNATITPATTNAVPVAPNGGQFMCSVPGASTILQDEIDCTCASGTCAFVVNSTGQ